MGIDRLEGEGKAIFNPSFLHYEADESWVEDALLAIKKTLGKENGPEHSDECELGKYLAPTFEKGKRR